MHRKSRHNTATMEKFVRRTGGQNATTPCQGKHWQADELVRYHMQEHSQMGLNGETSKTRRMVTLNCFLLLVALEEEDI